MGTALRVRTLLLAAFVAAPFAQAVHAEEPEHLVTINVPFAFEDGRQHFSPGEYTFSIAAQRVVNILGKSDSGYAMTWFDQNRQPSKVSKVVFREYGNHYFIDQIWVAGSEKRTSFIPSKREKREMAALASAPTEVELAALNPSR
jgi:hypothetical protein